MKHAGVSKGIPQQAEVALGVPGRLRPRIFSTFDTTRVVGRQPNAPAAFTSGEIPGTHFQSLSRPQGTWFCRKELRKKSQVTPPGIDPGTFRLVAQRLNHFTTPGPTCIILIKWWPNNICQHSYDFVRYIMFKYFKECDVFRLVTLQQLSVEYTNCFSLIFCHLQEHVWS